MDYVSPAIHKWYGPRYLPETYMAPWYDQGSNFARDTYLRYISLILEGDETYDTFGTPLGRGWLVYNWQQDQPGTRGSFIDKRRGGLSSRRPDGQPAAGLPRLLQPLGHRFRPARRIVVPADDRR